MSFSVQARKKLYSRTIIAVPRMMIKSVRVRYLTKLSQCRKYIVERAILLPHKHDGAIAIMFMERKIQYFQIVNSTAVVERRSKSPVTVNGMAYNARSLAVSEYSYGQIEQSTI